MKVSASQRSVQSFGGLSSKGTSENAKDSGETWCPLKPECFRVHLPIGSKRRKGGKNKGDGIRGTDVGGVGASERLYAYTVDPGSPSDRGSYIHGVLDKVTEDCEKYTSGLSNEHGRCVGARFSARARRARCFETGRRFPALVTTRLVMSKGSSESVEPWIVDTGHDSTCIEEKAPRANLLAPTVSLACKAVEKRVPQSMAPFLPGGLCRQLGTATLPAEPEDYDAAEQAERQGRGEKKRRWLDGAFLPTSPTSSPSSKAVAATAASRSPRLPQGRTLQLQRLAGVPSLLAAPGANAAGETDSPQRVGVARTIVFADADSVSARSTPTSHRHEDGFCGGDTSTAVSRCSNSGVTQRRSAGEATTPTARVTRSRTEDILGGGHDSGVAVGGVHASPSAATQVSRAHSVFLVRGCGPEVGSLASQEQDYWLRESKRQELEARTWKVFKWLAPSGRIGLSACYTALTQLGFKSVDTEWVDEAFANLHKRCSGAITYDQFLELRSEYEERLRHHYYETFKGFVEDDGSKIVDVSEVEGILTRLGIEPMRHVLEELIAEVDDDRSGGLEFNEFQHLMDVLRTREGFVRSEYEEMMNVFAQFTAREGVLRTESVALAIDWLGLTVKGDDLERILIEADLDNSGTIEESEWMWCMRRIRDATIENVKRTIAMCNGGAGVQGTMAFSDLDMIFKHLGYVSGCDMLRECSEQSGISIDAAEGVDLSSIWRLLAVYREREGLSLMELKEVDDCFERHDPLHIGSVPSSKVGQMFRSLGFGLPVAQQQELLHKVDIDRSGRLDVKEFRKMIRMILFREQQGYKSAFYLEVAQNAKVSGSLDGGESVEPPTIGVNTARRALLQLNCPGCEDVPEISPEDLLRDDTVDVFGFCRAAIRRRHEARMAFKRCGGFGKEEMEDMKLRFDRFDADSSGELSGTEIGDLLKSEFPLLYVDPVLRTQVTQILEEADEDCNGKLDFLDFLRVMRLFRDIQEQLRIEKEMKAMQGAHFMPSEVEEFRQLFNAARQREPNASGSELSFDQVKDMLAAIVPMGTKNNDELEKAFKRQVSKRSGHTSGSDQANLLDFPEFLWLMRSLLDANWGNILSHCEPEER